MPLDVQNHYINLTLENIENEDLCCAISDKKHQCGVYTKKEWLKDRLLEGHVFRKLNQKGKVFIEYAPLEKAWVPILGDNYIYIYCLWVSGNFKGKGYGKELLQYCIEDAKNKNKSGVCIISSKKKKPFLSDKKFVQKFGFEAVDNIGDDYELLALSFDGTKPNFSETTREQAIQNKNLTIYYGMQCPYIPNCIAQVDSYCKNNNIQLDLFKIDTLEKAKSVPCVFNNWAVFYNGKFKTVHLLNEGYVKKIFEEPDGIN
jgi:ribosomal protein S18 acetylase RimI-like enzyme